MKIAKDAIPLIIPPILIIIILYSCRGKVTSPLQIIISFIAFIFLCLTIYFFRDPERKFPDEPNTIISPADGKVVTIDELDAPDNSGKKMKRIGIFMSILDVHINRSPYSGTINFIKYNKGKFLNALNDKSSDQNENNIIGINTGKEIIFVKQIAGIIARRIVCRVKVGDKIQKGARLGMIKFGSRVEAFIPLNTQIIVKLDDKVKAGKDIIGYIL